MKAIYFILFTFLSFQNILGMNDSLPIKVTLNNEVVELHKSYYIPSIKDSIRIDKLKFYIRTFETRSISKSIMDTWVSVFNLIDLEDSNTLKIKPLVRNFFLFGVDSTTQVSGAMPGDLDPTKGMYWSWQSGYINFKMEGSSKACPSRKNQFQFHLGGYQAPNNTCHQLLFIDSTEPKKSNPININHNVTLELKLDSFFSNVDITKTYRIMSPGKEAFDLSLLLKESFYYRDED